MDFHLQVNKRQLNKLISRLRKSDRFRSHFFHFFLQFSVNTNFLEKTINFILSISRGFKYSFLVITKSDQCRVQRISDVGVPV